MSKLRCKDAEKVACAGLNLELTFHHIQDSMATRRSKPGVHRGGRDRQLLVDTTGAIESAELEPGTDRIPVFLAAAAAVHSFSGESEKGLRQDSVAAPLAQVFFFPLFDPQGPHLWANRRMCSSGTCASRANSKHRPFRGTCSLGGTSWPPCSSSYHLQVRYPSWSNRASRGLGNVG
jgi:hypothetical protein